MNSFQIPYQVQDTKGLELVLQSLVDAQNSNTVGGSINEIGGIIAFGGTIAPTGWLLCDGSAISRTTFSALFAVLGTAFGAGDGSTTFNLPNLKGRVPVGLDGSQVEFDQMGETGGAKTHTLVIGEIPSHSHIEKFSSGANNGVTGIGQTLNQSAVPGINSSYTTDVAGGGGAHNNLQPYQVVNYIIRYALPTKSGNLSTDLKIAFSGYGAGTQTLTANTWSKVSLSLEDYDLGNNFDTTNYRFLAPANGIYHFSGRWYNTTGGSFSRIIALFKNGSEVKRGSWLQGSSNYQAPVLATDLKLQVGDYIELYAYVENVNSVLAHSISETFLTGHLITTT